MKFTHYIIASECYPRYKNAMKRISDTLQRTDKLMTETVGKSHQNDKDIKLKENVDIYICEIGESEKLDLNENLVLKKHGKLNPVICEFESIEAFLTQYRNDFDPSTILIFRECKYSICQQIRFSRDASLIIVNEKENGSFADKINDHLQVAITVSSEKDIAAAISSLLEQAAFKPMKDKFECIRSLLNGNYNKSDNTRSSGLPKRYECSALKRSGKKRKIEHEIVQENGLRMVTRSQNATPYQNSCAKRMKLNKKIEKCNVIKEESFKAKPKYNKTHDQKFKCGTAVKRVADFQRLLGEMIGMYRRSNLPENLKPALDGPIEGNKINQIIKELYKISSSVKGYSYKFIVRLQIHVLRDDIERLEQDIAKILERNGIASDYYDIVSPLDDVTPFNQILVGAAVTAKVPVRGSLACIVKTTKENEESKYCALASKHLLRGLETVELSNADRTLTAHVVKETAPWDATMQFDIAAAEIQQNDEIHCDGRFKTEGGELMQGEMSAKDDRQLQCLNVHINGASTPLGLGIIASTLYTTRDQNEAHNENRRYIHIAPRNSSEPFCREGDSGAMVCADHEDGNHVELISTVNGKASDGLIATLRIQDGISHLQSVSMTNIEFI